MKYAVWPLLVCTCLLSACSRRTLSFSQCTTPPAPDYSIATSWAVLPGTHSYADSIPEKNLTKDPAQVDVFFVYPTSYIGKRKKTEYWNADIHDAAINMKTQTGYILNQASVFNVSGRIYAPYYRQAHLQAFYTQDKQSAAQALDTAYADVRNAFQYYMTFYNNGRPVIIASHSQGSYHAKRLLKEFFDSTTLATRLVAAYIIGMPIDTAYFESLKPCVNNTDIQCYCTWNTFQYGYTPKYYNNGLNHAVCTNPLNWRIDTTYAAKTLNLGAVLDHFNEVYPQLCDAQVHKGMLWVHPPVLDHRPGLNIIFKRAHIYHIVDYNLFYLNIRQNVKQRVDWYIKKSKQLKI